MTGAMEDLFRWESADDWYHAPGRIHMLGGMYRLGPGAPGSLTEEGLTLVGSYEAEQHIAHLRSLTRAQPTAGADRTCGVAGEAIVLARFGNRIDARVTFEGFPATQPIAVETGEVRGVA